jgi:hypothetical protein
MRESEKKGGDNPADEGEIGRHYLLFAALVQRKANF